jgi:hypothetical protein
MALSERIGKTCVAESVEPSLFLPIKGDVKPVTSRLPDGVFVNGVLNLLFELGVGVAGGLDLTELPVGVLLLVEVEGPAGEEPLTLGCGGLLKKPKSVVCLPCEEDDGVGGIFRPLWSIV